MDKLKTILRVASLVMLLVAAMGPWFADSHPATAETCPPPLVWLGDGHCACLVTLVAFAGHVISGMNLSWFLLLPPALPVLSTLLLLPVGERRWLRVLHLTAWGAAGIYALLLFAGIWYADRELILWGAGLCGVTAVGVLAGEIVAGKAATRKETS